MQTFPPLIKRVKYVIGNSKLHFINILLTRTIHVARWD